MKKILLGSLATFTIYSTSVLADQRFLDDVIVEGSICVGLDCVNGESFGFDTIRLKENNLRIRAVDTSTSASFPTRDWQITFNESSNGGANKFSIEDIDGGRIPFTIEAGAPSDSLFVEDSGQIGIGTNTPVADLHVKSGNTPTLRLEQDGSSGFTAQTWDVAGNEANFFIRDATNGSTLPFRIFPGAPTSSLAIEASGQVGIGTTTPDTNLHIRDNANPATADVRTLLTLDSKYGSNIKFEHRNNVGREWTVGSYSSGDGFLISRADTVDGNADAFDNYNLLLNDNFFIIRNVAAEELMRLTNTELTVNGTVVSSSSRTVKDNIKPVDPNNILDLVSSLAINKWNYTHDNASTKHIGPFAEDFYELFGLGSDEKHIASLDTSGVALAAIQALNNEVQAKNSRIETLEAQNRLLNKRFTAMEKAIHLHQLSSK